MEDKTVIHIDVTPRPQNDREVHQIAKKVPKIVEDFKYTPKEILLEQENYIVTGQSYSEYIDFSLCLVRMKAYLLVLNKCISLCLTIVLIEKFETSYSLATLLSSKEITKNV